MPGSGAYIADIEALTAETLGRRDGDDDSETDIPGDAQLISLFLSDGLDVLLDADRHVDEWIEHPTDTAAIDRLAHELEQLTGNAREAGLTDVAELTEALADVYLLAIEHRQAPDAWLLETVRSAHDHLINLMDQVAAGLATQPDQSLQAELLTVADTLRTTAADADDEAIELALPETDDSAIPAAETETPFSADADTDSPEGDDELVAIFLEEAQDLISSTADALESWQERPDSGELLRLLQRDLHTLKGGARLTGIAAMGDLSHELETLFEGLGEHRLAVTNELSDLLFRCHDRLAGMVDALAAGEQPRPAPDLIGDIREYMDSATGTRRVTDIPGTTGQNDSDHAEDAPAEADTDDAEVSGDEFSPEGSADNAGTDDEELPRWELEPDEEQLAADINADDNNEALSYDLSHMDPELVSIFLEEAYDLINATGSTLHTWSENPGDSAVAAELQRDVHTLKGGARMAGVDAIADLTHVLEDLFEKVAEGTLSASGEMTDLLFACHDRLAGMVEEVATSRPCPPATELVSQVQAILSGNSATDHSADHPVSELDSDSEEIEFGLPAEVATTDDDIAESDSGEDDIAGLFLEEGMDVLESIEESLGHWRDDPDQLTGITQLQQELHTLKGGARLADVDPVADLAEAWSDSLGPLIEGSGNQPLALSINSSSCWRTGNRNRKAITSIRNRNGVCIL